LPTFLLVINPQRVWLSLLRAAFNTINSEPQVRPSRLTRSNCAPLLSRSNCFTIMGGFELPCSRFKPACEQGAEKGKLRSVSAVTALTSAGPFARR
jgi:hypothetical protein